MSGACVARLRSQSLRSRRRPILGTPGAVSSSEPSLLYQPTTHEAMRVWAAALSPHHMWHMCACRVVADTGVAMLSCWYHSFAR